MNGITNDNFSDIGATFGVAGNFTGHLEQTGEAKDFAEVVTADANAPKALFPTFISKIADKTPAFLNVFPFDEEKILFPKDEETLQIEPECGMIFSVVYENEKVRNLIPVSAAASNDCSIRNPSSATFYFSENGKNVIKISQKKNWGASSKGFSSTQIPIDCFEKGGILDSYSIASFLIRDGNISVYGETSPVSGYSYNYRRLVDWIIDRLNFQKCKGPAEEISVYMKEAGFPEKIMVSVGATRYTEFGEKTFLKGGDVSVVVLFPHEKFTEEQIKSKIMADDFSEDERKEISILRQKIV